MGYLTQQQVNDLPDNTPAMVQFGASPKPRRYLLRKCPGTHVKRAVDGRGATVAYLYYVGELDSQAKVTLLENGSG